MGARPASAPLAVRLRQRPRAGETGRGHTLHPESPSRMASSRASTAACATNFWRMSPPD